MTKKWLMYVVTGLLCCGALAFAVSKQSSKQNMSSRDRAKLELVSIEQMMLKVGQTQELTDRQTELKIQLGFQTAAPKAGPAVSATTPEGYVAPVTQEVTRVDEKQIAYDQFQGILARYNAGMQLTPEEKVLLTPYLESLPAVEDNSGRRSLDDTGGPSPFGYVWKDNLNGDTTTFAWEEPTTPTELATIAQSDDGSQLCTWGFNFPFYGTNYTAGNVGTNGYIDFAATATDFSNDCPLTTFPSGACIFPFWDDGHTSNGGSSDGGRIVYQTYADHVTITWDSVGVFLGTGDILDYQVQLWTDGKIRMQYRQIRNTVNANLPGKSATIAIQQSGTLDDLTYHCSTVMDSAYTNALDGRAIWWYIDQTSTGRCCYWDGTEERCLDGSTFEECSTLGGDYLIDGICDTDRCELGRCCYWDGAAEQCGEFTVQHCTALSGTWVGGIDCTTPCPVGRCCYNNGANCGDFTALHCTALGGTFDAALNCTTNPCPIVLPGGETCDDRVALTVGQSWSSTTVDNVAEVGVPVCGSGYNATSPGEWYSVIGNGNTLTLSLCDPLTTFDSEIFVFCGSCTALNCIGGDDDFCATPGLASELSWCSAVGQEYFLLCTGFAGSGPYAAIILDGAACVDPIPCTTTVGRCCYNNGQNCADNTAGACAGLGGQWDSTMTCAANPCVNPCVLACGPFDIVEASEVGQCPVGTIDDPNGGCNNVVPTYTEIACGDSVCAEAFTCLDGSGRDTDWFRFTLTDTSNVTVTAVSEFNNLLFGIVDITSCAGAFFITNGFVTDCSLGSQSVTALCLPPGQYVAFGAFGAFTGLPEGGASNSYRMWVDCSPCTPPVGQCCYFDGVNAQCVNTTQGDCEITLGGIWNQFGDCLVDVCPVGRCCYDNGLACLDVTEDECNFLVGTWDQFSDCVTNPCPIPPVNDDCANALELVVVPNGSVTAAVDNAGANVSCTDTCDFDSNGPDQFFFFTLTECRLIAIMADPNDPHLSVYADGQCCVTPALYCNDDFGNFVPDLDLYPWLPLATRPVSGLGSMIADSFAAGTYIIRAGYFGTGSTPYTLTLFDFGPCVIAPCDPIVDLAIFAEPTVGAPHQPVNAKLFWTAPQADDYKVWSSTNPNNDGNPNDGADIDWTLDATLLGLAAGPQSWQAPAGFFGSGPIGGPKFYVVTAVCEPFVAPVGRCCYGAFLCDDVTEAACNDLAGTWSQFLNCTTNPCPPPPPANDDCGNAVPVTNGVPVAGTTVAATGTDISSCAFNDITDVWYTFNALTLSPVTVSTCEATFFMDNTLALYDGCGGAQLACVDDVCPVNFAQSEIVYTPLAIGTIWIRVAGYNAAENTFTLTVTQ